MFPNDEDGREWADELNGSPALFATHGYEVVPSGFSRNLTEDFSAVIALFEERECQMLTGAPLPPDFTTFWTQTCQRGFSPKVATIAKAILFPPAVEALGDLGHNLSSEIWWSGSHPFSSSLTGQPTQALAEHYEQATGKQWSQPGSSPTAIPTRSCNRRPYADLRRVAICQFAFFITIILS
ncbi:hypothetical protein [Oceaniglobus ichthyenteri]|uniref:hypothetical protein n=1 Tax=Oceaniglobus ichthyenteri TaxID=2136177 RepID=UPI003B8306E7